MADRKCPRCGLWNSETAIYCDCGCDLINGTISENPAVVPGLNSQKRIKKGTKTKVIIGVVIGFLAILLFSFVYIMSRVNLEIAPVTSVLDSYMKFLVVKDTNSAYALFSPRAQRQFPISKIEELIQGKNYLLIEGYQSLSIQKINIAATINSNSDIPQGTVATVSGITRYDGNIQGTFTGTLEKVNGKWLIDGINITVPPDKIK
jgi:hypothetical protein